MKNVKLYPVKTRCNGLSVNLDKQKHLQFHLVDEPAPRKKSRVLKEVKSFIYHVWVIAGVKNVCRNRGAPQ